MDTKTCPLCKREMVITRDAQRCQNCWTESNRRIIYDRKNDRWIAPLKNGSRMVIDADGMKLQTSTKHTEL